jgi:UDP-glucuronate 4-epimerase
MIEVKKEFGYRPSTTLEEGLKAFAEWYKAYYSRSLPLAQ